MRSEKFHTNEHGETSVCPAKIQCRLKDMFGNPVEHYHSKKEAHAAYERLAEQLYKSTSSLTKNPKGNNNIKEEIGNLNSAIEYIIAKNKPLHAIAEKQEKLLVSARQEERILSDDEYEERVQYIDKVMGILTNSNMTTRDEYIVEDSEFGNRYTPERKKLHKNIVKEWVKRYDKVPSDGDVLFAGGLGGAGKSTVLADHMGIQENEYAVLNPDDIKEYMAENDWIPKVPGLTPMEASPLVHEEASHITKLLQSRLMKKKKNILFDTTLSDTYSAERKIQQLIRRGYQKENIHGVFVDITPDTALERAEARHRAGLNQYTKDRKGCGGRYLPRAINDNQRPDGNSDHTSKNAENAVDLKNEGFLASLTVFNNNDDAPEKIEYDEFIKRSWY